MNTSTMNLLDFFLILAFMGAMQTMFAMGITITLYFLVTRFINRSRNNGR